MEDRCQRKGCVRFPVPDPVTEDLDPSARVTLVMKVDDKVVENNLGLPVI